MKLNEEKEFDLEQAAGEVYEMAEEMYNGSEINSDTLHSVMIMYFMDDFTADEMDQIDEYFKEQDRMFFAMYGKNKKVTEATDSTMDGKDVTNEFRFIKAFQSNFEPIKVIKNSYDKNYYIYKADETNTNNYLDFSKSKDYIEGWLRGAVKAKNNVISSKTESLQENAQLGRIPTSELPDFCYSYNNTTGEIIVIKKGVEGYYPSNITLDNTLSGGERKQQAEELIKEQNEILGVTDDQRLQMELNSMFGWDDTKTESKETTSFEEIINMMERAQDYSELYNAASYIKDDNLRVDVEELIGQCEDDEDDVKTAYSLVTSDLLDNKRDELNEGLEIGGEDISIDSIFHFPNVIYAMQETCREAIMELQAEDKSFVTEKDVRVIYNELSKLEDIVNKYLEKTNPDDNIIESKKVTEGYVIGLSTKTVRELAEDEVYDKYVQDIKDGPVGTLNITTTDNIEDALQIEEKFDAHTLADEIKERYPEWNSVVAFFK